MTHDKGTINTPEKKPGKISVALYPQFNLVHFFGEGNISYRYLLEQILTLHEDPQWSPKYNCFIDFGAAHVSYDSEGFSEYQAFFDVMQETANPRKWAIYTRQEMTHKSANMNHLLQSKAIRVDVFNSRSESLDFLGVNPDQFESVSQL